MKSVITLAQLQKAPCSPEWSSKFTTEVKKTFTLLLFLLLMNIKSPVKERWVNKTLQHI